MSTQPVPPPVASQTARRINVAFIIMLLLIVVITAILYLLLPRQGVNTLITSVMAGLTVLNIGLIIWTWRASHQSGTVLLNLGRTEKQPLYWIVTGLLLGIPTLYLYLTDEQHEIYRLVQSVFWLTVVAAGLVLYRQPTLITDRGWYKGGGLFPWDDIATYEWGTPQRKVIMLVLTFKHRRYLAYSSKFPVPVVHKAAVEALFTQYSTAKSVMDEADALE